MKMLILVRSGLSTWACENRIQGTVSLPLSDEGREHLKVVADEIARLAPAVVYSSGNESAGPTAQFLGELCRLRVRTLPDLHELDCGLWQGLTVEELQRRFGRVYRLWCQDPTAVCPPQGETAAAAAARVWPALKTLGKRTRDKVVVLVAAPIVACLIECIITGRPISELWQVSAEATGISVFERQDRNEIMTLVADEPISKLSWPLVVAPDAEAAPAACFKVKTA